MMTNEMVEAFIPELRKQGYQFAVVYRHEKDDTLRFYDAYKSVYDFTGARKHWPKKGYIVSKIFDFDELDTRPLREKRRERRPNRATLEC